MNFTYTILQFPPALLLAICAILFALIGAGGTYLFRKYVKLNYLRAHNEVVGYVFAILGGFYGLLLGFVVFFVWDSLNQAQNNANREGGLARGLYRDIKYYPKQQEVKQLMNTYIIYVHSVVEQEYPAIEHLQPINKNSRKYFNDVFRELEKLNPNDPRIEQMFVHLNELNTYRALRQLDASSEIPGEIWLPLIMGAFIILIFAMMIEVQSVRLHMLINSLMGAFIALVIYIIIIIDHPFTGKMRIEPTEYQTILQMHQEES